MHKRKFLFLKDVLFYTFTAFGGAQAHIGMMLKDFVQRRKYIEEQELLELNALSQVLPGPASTQTLVGMAYKVGGLWLAIVTFLIWILPSAAIMAFAAISYGLLDHQSHFQRILNLLQPMAIGIVAYAAYQFAKTILKSQVTIVLAISALAVTLILKNAYVFPLLILIGGIVTSALETPLEESLLRSKLYANINPRKVIYFLGVLLFFAALGAVISRTSPFSLPIRLFENFYRNGILVFGGGQVLVPYMFTEFVEMKHYLSSSEFLSGFALQQALPGPTFSFSSFLGALSLKNAGYGLLGQIGGSLIAVIGINLPGLILILFIVPFWNDLKKISQIKNSLSGINAVSVGFLGAAVLFLLQSQDLNWIAMALMLSSFLLLAFTRIKTPVLIIGFIVLSYIAGL
ncbi:MAG: chromate efflux transporter [Sphingobacteriaceae bacterium]